MERRDTSQTTIHLVRHGHIMNPDAVYHGRLPGFPLSDKGRAQAAAAAEWLRERPITAIYCSPMLRTRQTGEIIRDALQPPPPLYVEPLLNEVYSPFDGRSHEEMAARNWDFYTGVDAPYEQPQDILQRVLVFFDRVREQHEGQQVVGVTHADPLAFLWLWAREQPLTPEDRKRLDVFGLPDDYPATASISTFVFGDDRSGVQPHSEYVRPY
ncbi:MAG TPA: histidine phosphatase family protein [Candidatus Sulfomarinibacteraceae bacterium]|nr:histidine phosphatase family protein [Candidatus Sulfomarinibacteraceae bacterium]